MFHYFVVPSLALRTGSGYGAKNKVLLSPRITRLIEEVNSDA
jgi:hypothetical protein